MLKTITYLAIEWQEESSGTLSDDKMSAIMSSLNKRYQTRNTYLPMFVECQRRCIDQCIRQPDICNFFRPPTDLRECVF